MLQSKFCPDTLLFNLLTPDYGGESINMECSDVKFQPASFFLPLQLEFMPQEEKKGGQEGKQLNT